jgi:uracil-DNA glycosylase
METENEIKIDFGTIGLVIGDEIIFQDGKTCTKVCSGGGGTLVSLKGYVKDTGISNLCSLAIFTRDYINQPIDIKNNDVFSMWFFKGKSLLEIYNNNVKIMNLKCDKCKEYGLGFYATNITPIDYIEGRRNADIWIIGLNPKGDIGKKEERTVDQFENFNPEKLEKNTSYFKDFDKVSNLLYKNFTGNNSNVAHTDLVKCFSLNFPHTKLSKDDLNKVLCRCREYLSEQLNRFKPRIIICNGSHVVYHIEQIIPVKEEFETYYIGIGNNSYEPFVFRSGFIGRIDHHAKRRLGKEIENILNEINLSI